MTHCDGTMMLWNFLSRDMTESIPLSFTLESDKINLKYTPNHSQNYKIMNLPKFDRKTSMLALVWGPRT